MKFGKALELDLYFSLDGAVGDMVMNHPSHRQVFRRMGIVSIPNEELFLMALL